MMNPPRNLDAVFSALGDPIRRRMVERLARGPLSIGELAAGFPVSQPAISRHVRVLEESGLLQRQVLGRVHRCTLSSATMDAVSTWIERQRRFWNAALDRLDALLTDSPTRRKKR